MSAETSHGREFVDSLGFNVGSGRLSFSWRSLELLLSRSPVRPLLGSPSFSAPAQSKSPNTQLDAGCIRLLR